MIKTMITVQGRNGLHARPASQLCALARLFESEIGLLVRHHRLDGKSVLDLMAGGLSRGTCIELICNGKDEDMAMAAICNFFDEME